MGEEKAFPPLTYASWEHENLYGCVCDPHYSGADCSLRPCPRGDDPWTVDQNDRVIIITTAADAGTEMTGSFTFTFMGESVEFPADAGSVTDCDNFFETHLAIQDIDCTITSVDEDTKGGTWTISFIEFENPPFENNIYSHNGNPGLEMFTCTADSVTTGTNPTCVITDDGASTNIKEFDLCSNRGVCDLAIGTCKCFIGSDGAACQYQNDAAITYTQNMNDKFVVFAPELNYEGSILRMLSGQQPADKFKFWAATAATTTVADMMGTGQLNLYAGGLNVQGGGIKVAANGGGLTVDQNGGDVNLYTKAYFHDQIEILHGLHVQGAPFDMRPPPSPPLTLQNRVHLCCASFVILD